MSEGNELRGRILAAVAEYGSINKAAAALGVARSTAQDWYKAELKRAELSIPDLPSPDIPIEELIRRRTEDFARRWKAHQARREIRIKVKSNLPIGIATFGDPHVDDDGCDLETLLRDADTVRETPGMYGMNVGDNQNLWMGRLLRKYADQTTRADDGWRLTEYFIKRTRDWLALVWGNHDHWAGIGDPLVALAKAHFPVSDGYDVRITLVFPNGREFSIWMRHDFAGNSQWNDLHGLMKAAKMGARFHLFVAGHKHTSAHHAQWNEDTGIFWHALRSAGYKKIDDYTEMLGFKYTNVFQCPVVIIDPLANNPAGFSKVEYNTEDGADRLTWLRKRRGA